MKERGKYYMKDLKTLETQLAEVHKELHELEKLWEKERKKGGHRYVTEINNLLKREHNIYININQEKQRRR